MTADHETVHLTPNPRFLPGLPFSYESVLCRLSGWWTMGANSLTVREIITKRLAVLLLCLMVGLSLGCQRPPKEPVCLTWITPCP